MAELCAGCLRDGERKPCESWCSDCCEPVCKSCAIFHQKLAPPHHIISMDDVEKFSQSLFRLSRICEHQTKEQITFFCCQHDTTICALCVTQSYQKCKSIDSLEEAAKDVRKKWAILDLERRMGNMIKETESILGHLAKNMSDLNDEKTEIERMISETKENVIAYIDKLSKKLYTKLEKKCHAITEISEKYQSELRSKAEMLISWTNDLNALKTKFSDILLFQVVKYIDSKVCQLEVKSRDTEQIPQLSKIVFRPEDAESKIKNVLPSLGSVEIEAASCQISASLEIDMQAQYLVKSAEKRKMTLVSSFDTKNFGTVFRGCFISTSRLLLSVHNSRNLVVCNINGTSHSLIKAKGDVSYITRYNDDQALAVSGECIQIIDHKIRTAGKLIPIEGEKLGPIAFSKDKIVVKNKRTTITHYNDNGRLLKEMHTSFNAHDICLNKDGDIYCTDTNSDKIYVVTNRGVDQFI